MKRIIFAVSMAALIFSGCQKIDDVPQSEAITSEIEISDDILPETTVPGTTSFPESKTTFKTEDQTEFIPAEPAGGDIEESFTEETEETLPEETAASAAESENIPGEDENISEVTDIPAEETDNDGLTYFDGILIVNKTYPLPADYAPGINGEAQKAFDKMQADAADLGLNIYISSGFRSYDYQAGLYQRYVDRDGKAAADRYSARPGHSEHQTGLAFDLNTITDEFKDTDEGKWVAANCYKYGFIIRYPADKEDVTGYMYEPWYIRYLGEETAQTVYDSGLCLEEYLGITSEYAE